MRALAVRVAVVLALALVAIGGAASAAQAEPRIEIELGPITVCKIYWVPILNIPILYDCYTIGTA